MEKVTNNITIEINKRIENLSVLLNQKADKSRIDELNAKLIEINNLIKVLSEAKKEVDVKFEDKVTKNIIIEIGKRIESMETSEKEYFKSEKVLIEKANHALIEDVNKKIENL